MKNFRDRVAVVTGGASGIGYALAEKFASVGAKVVLADLEEEALRLAVARLRERGATALALPTDVSKLSEVEALADQTLKEFGAVHIVCNNAGVGGPTGPIWETTQADWEWVLGPNLWGVIHGIRVFTPILLQQGDEGHIVNTASIAGLISGPGLAIYKVTKHSVVTLSETLYHDLRAAGSKVGCSVLCPAWVATRIAESERNRPAHLVNSSKTTPSGDHPLLELAKQVIAAGTPPSAIADIVAQAIQEQRFYILPHPEWKQWIQGRLEQIISEAPPHGGPGLA
jgi:NAD(P)-dependent dehydrogenase (short-subunit alcohol dehydrogenase family)